MPIRKAPFFVLAAFALAACDPGEAESDADVTADAIRGGEITNERRDNIDILFAKGEGGKQVTCTATYLADDVLLSAARCVYVPERPVEGYVNPEDRQRRNVVAHAFVGGPHREGVLTDYNRTLVLLKLRPSADKLDVAPEPVEVASTAPTWGTKLTMFGHGCTGSWLTAPSATADGWGPLRKRDVEWGLVLSTSAACTSTDPIETGDLGSPLFDRSGRVAAVLGYIEPGAIVFGTDELVAITSGLADEIRTKTATLGR